MTDTLVARPELATALRDGRPEHTQLSLRRWLVLIAGVSALIATVMIVAGILALARLSDARSVVLDRIDPATRAANDLTIALLNEETGLRGYAATRDEQYLGPYVTGQQQERAAAGVLHRLIDSPGTPIQVDTDEVQRQIAIWRQQYAEPTIRAVRAGTTPPTIQAGKELFDGIRAAQGTQQRLLDAEGVRARDRLNAAATVLRTVLIGISIGLVLLLAVILYGVRRIIIRPISQLAGTVREVADGDFRSAVRTSGPREIAQLGDDVEAMRQHIVTELTALQDAHSQLDEQARDLQRSNAELEQFAYVASHDLQEPLRKVASFSQLLERRYKGQLDERADQYIAFAVDGAKRMQVLINDLLAFSRVGRLTREHTEIDGKDLLDAATGNLAILIEETGTEITADELPRLRGDASLLTGVFQNLINNAIKFRGDEPPRIHLGVRDDGDCWEFALADNGIGIESEYAERIFVIFQRLHPKDAYPGTGIGLAMCRKIIEYHGGRIWLDTERTGGTTFRFTLPKIEETGSADE